MKFFMENTFNNILKGGACILFYYSNYIDLTGINNVGVRNIDFLYMTSELLFGGLLTESGKTG